MEWPWIILFLYFYLYPLGIFFYDSYTYSSETKGCVGVFYILAIVGIFLAFDRNTEGLGIFLAIGLPLLSYYFILNDQGPAPIKRKAKPKKFTGINVKTGRKVNFSSKANLNKAIKSGRTQSVEDYKAEQKLLKKKQDLLKKKKLKEKQKSLEKKLPYDIIK